MPVKNVTTSGTAERLTSTSALPSGSKCWRLTIQWKPANTSTTKIYIGYTKPHGVGSTVSSTVYDAVLTSSVVALTLESNCGNGIDISGIYLDSSASGEGVSYLAEVQ